MKKFFALLIAILLIATPVYALQSKVSQSGRSDEVWTQVRIGTNYPVLVSRGHVLIISTDSQTLATNDGFLAKHADASLGQVIAGVVQATDVTSGDYTRVLLRGRGYLRSATKNTTSLDIMSTTLATTLTSHRGCVVPFIRSGAYHTTTSYNNGVGQALESESSEDTVFDAYINVL